MKILLKAELKCKNEQGIGDRPDQAQSAMFETMKVEECFIKLQDGNYLAAYENILAELKKTVM